MSQRPEACQNLGTDDSAFWFAGLGQALARGSQGWEGIGVTSGATPGILIDEVGGPSHYITPWEAMSPGPGRLAARTQGLYHQAASQPAFLPLLNLLTLGAADWLHGSLE